MAFESGQWGPDTFIDSAGNTVLIGATVTASGYVCTVDALGNLTITGPATDSLTVTVTPATGAAYTAVVAVKPLVSELEDVQTAASAASALAAAAETPAGSQAKADAAEAAAEATAAAALAAKAAEDTGTFQAFGAGEIVPAGPVQVGRTMFGLPQPTVHSAFPTVVLLDDDETYLVSWRGGPNHGGLDGVIYVSTTTDWRTYTTPVIVATTSRDPSVMQLANGDVLLTYYNDATFRSYVLRSTDNGATWGAATVLPFTWTITAGALRGYQFVAAPPIQTGDGTVLVCAYGHDTGGTYDSVRVLRSTDNGATWGAEITAANGTTDSQNYYEPNLVSLGGGSVLLMIRGDQSIRKATSADHGATWSAVSYSFVGTGNPHLLRFRSGTLACLYRNFDNGNADIRTSRDNGVTWTRGTSWGQAGSRMAYAAAVEHPTIDGQAMCVWSREDSETSAWLMAVGISEASGVTPTGEVFAASAADATANVLPAIYISAMDLRSTGGAALGAIGSGITPVLLFDASAAEIAHFSVMLPPAWQTFDLELLFAPATTGTGLVAWDMSYFTLDTYTTMGSGTYVAGLGANITTSAAGRIYTSRPLRSITAPGENTPISFRLIRDATDATLDTYAADVGVIGVKLIRRT